MSKKIIFLVLSCLLLGTVCSAPSDGKCKLLATEEERVIVYSCIQVDYEAVNEIASEAEWIEFTVSKRLQLPSRAFARFHLRVLSFYDCAFRDIDPNAFDGLPNLKSLTIWGSNVHVARTSWFRGLSGLTYLALPRNELVYVEPDLFAMTPNLEHLSFEDNDLNCLSPRALDPLRKLKRVLIGKNPWLCKCYRELVEWMNARRVSFEVNDTNSRMECMAEYSWTSIATSSSSTSTSSSSYTSSRNASYVEVTSSKDATCVGKRISALSEIPEDARSIVFRNSHITKVAGFAFFKFGNNLRRLEFINSDLRDVDAEAFAGLAKLEELVMFNNTIETVRADWFRDLRDLKHLSLDRNRIQRIEPGVYPALENLETLSLNDNELQCLSPDEFSSMRKLQKINLSNNPWNCTCRLEFTRWLVSRQIGYKINAGACRDAGLVPEGKQFVTTYQNSTYHQRVSYDKTTTIHSQGQQHSSNGAGNEVTSVYEYVPAVIEIREEKNRVENDRQRQQQQQQQQQLRLPDRYPPSNGRPMLSTTDAAVGATDSQRYQRPKQQLDCSQRELSTSLVPDYAASRYEYSNWPEQRISGDSFPDNRCRIVVSTPCRGAVAYTCVHRSRFDWDLILSEATAVRFENSVIPTIPEHAFERFANRLRVLELLNCGIRDVDPRAFAGLVRLEELSLSGNRIRLVRAEWFQSTRVLRSLDLSRNMIGKIETGVFQAIPYLGELHLGSNQLNCIGLEEIAGLERLVRVDIRRNAWSCLCLEKLIEFLNQRNARYDEEVFARRMEWDCVPGLSDPPMIAVTTETPVVVPTPISDPRPGPPSNYIKRCSYNGVECSCDGGDLTDLSYVPDDVEIIEIANARVPRIPAEAFQRFSNLRKLTLRNSSIHQIDDDAFRGLRKLESLTLEQNSVGTVRSDWFRDLNALGQLNLVGNSIVEIESEVFEHIPELRELRLASNELRCVYTNSLMPLRKLEKMTVEENPLKWRCRDELAQYLDTRNVTYTKSDSFKGTCIPACGGPGFFNPVPSDYTKTSNAIMLDSISSIGVLCACSAMLVLVRI